MDYVVWKEGEYFISRCLNVEVSSFGETHAEAVRNLKEAVELYYEDEQTSDFNTVEDVSVGKEIINV